MTRKFRFISVRPVYDVTIVKITVKRVTPQNFEEVLGELHALLTDEQTPRILLNLEEVEYLYSMTLSRLASFGEEVRKKDGELRLCSLQPVIREVFDVTQLSKLFDIRGDERTALENFWGSSHEVQ